MTRLALHRCPGCGRALHLAPPPEGGDRWCDPCLQRIETIGRTTVDGLVARALERVVTAIMRVAVRLSDRADARRSAGEGVAERLLRCPAWFTGRGAA